MACSRDAASSLTSTTGIWSEAGSSQAGDGPVGREIGTQQLLNLQIMDNKAILAE